VCSAAAQPPRTTFVSHQWFLNQQARPAPTAIDKLSTPTHPTHLRHHLLGVCIQILDLDQPLLQLRLTKQHQVGDALLQCIPQLQGRKEGAGRKKKSISEECDALRQGAPQLQRRKQGAGKQANMGCWRQQDPRLMKCVRSGAARISVPTHPPGLPSWGLACSQTQP
jgi:hypothetical protein